MQKTNILFSILFFFFLCHANASQPASEVIEYPISEIIDLQIQQVDSPVSLPFFDQDARRAFFNQSIYSAFSIVNTTKNEVTIWLRTSVNIEFLYAKRGKDVFLNGKFISFKNRSFKKQNYTPINILSGDTAEIEVFMANLTNYPVKDKSLQLLNNEMANQSIANVPQRLITGHSIAVFFQGATWIMMIYMLLLFTQNPKEHMYFYYAVYMFFGMLYMYLKLDDVHPFQQLMPFSPKVRFILNEPLQFFVYLFYNAFVLSFLNIYAKDRKLYRIIQWLNMSYLAYALFITVFLVFTFDALARDFLFVVTRLIIVGISVFLILRILITIRGVLTRYIVIGSVFFMVGNVLAMVYSLGSDLPQIPFYPINFTHFGIFAELVCFSLGLGHRIRMQARERETLQEAYIQQLVMNDNIVRTSNRELKEKVENRTLEVLTKQKEIDEARAAEMEEKFQRQLIEIEMEALRLQMNPHFLFNSLNSIRLYVMQENPEKAADYITKFSKLLRNILQNNRQRTIRLSQELESLHLYLDFERERLSNRFEYDVHIDENLNPDDIEIQPMLLQPFVENAIWHGINHKNGKGNIWVKIKQKAPGILQISIEDNGIGRSKATQLKTLDGQSSPSVGMTNTQQRMKLISKLQKIALDFNIEDLEDENQNPNGTRITLNMPI